MPRLLLSALLAIGLASGYSGGPPDGRTGRPGESTCNDCHSGPAGSADSTALTGFPGSTYRADSTYSLAVTIRFAGQARWGFELTAVNSAGQRAGQLIVSDPTNTQLSPNAPGYLKHTSAGTHRGTGGPTSWSFNWRAPVAGTGPVTFYWCANAANNNGANTGDAICRDSLRVNEGTSIREERPAASRIFWRFSSPGRSRVVIDYRGRADVPARIYTASGRLVRTLSPTPNGELLRVVWDGRDLNGRAVTPAGYFVRLDTEIDAVLKVQLVR